MMTLSLQTISSISDATGQGVCSVWTIVAVGRGVASPEASHAQKGIAMKTSAQAEDTIVAATPTRDPRKISTRTHRIRGAFRLIPIDLSGTIGTFGQRLRLKELGLRSYPRRPEERKGRSLL